MFGSSILDVAIGLMFIYLLLSLACTSLNEAVASILNKRGLYLFEGIKNLLNDPAFTGLAQQVYSHGLVDGMSRGNGKHRRLPAYLNPETFSLALADVLSAQGAIRASHGQLLAAAEAADDRFELVRARSSGGPALDSAQQERDRAFAALDADAGRLRADWTQAADAAQADPASAELAGTAAAARNAYDAASGAVKLLMARRAATAAAGDSGRAELAGRAAAALQQALAAGRLIADASPDAIATLQHGIESLPDGHTKESLLVLLGKTRREVVGVEDRIARFQTNVEAWFNDAMTHVSGWYKRWTQAVVACLAVIVVLATNADTLQIVQHLSRDTALRTALVAAAEETARDTTPPEGDRADAVLREAENLTLPFGWKRWPHPFQARPLTVLSRLFGLFFSVLAVSLGAPFWFDTLNKVINVRGAGTPPGEPRRSAPRNTT